MNLITSLGIDAIHSPRSVMPQSTTEFGSLQARRGGVQVGICAISQRGNAKYVANMLRILYNSMSIKHTSVSLRRNLALISSEAYLGGQLLCIMDLPAG